MLNNFRINLVRRLIEINEKYFFDRKLKKVYKRKFGNDLNVAIDVGANRGQTIDLFLNLNPECTIYAFEPNPELFQNLVAKYKGRKNVKLFEMGVSDESGEKIFYENVFHATSTFEELNMDSKYLETKSKVLGVTPETIVRKSYPVKITSLFDFLSEQNLVDNKINILKIDTEGHEYYCLLGLFKNNQKYNIECVQLEMHNDDMYKNGRTIEEIEALLNKNGYYAKHKIKHGFGDFDDVIFERE